jgi:hypothetical protein
MASVNVS